MAQELIPFGFEASGDKAFAGANPVAYNVLIGGKGEIRRRPGLRYVGPTAAFSSYAISGLFVTDGGVTFAVDEEPGRRRFWRIKGTSAYDITGAIAQGDLDGTARPVFAETEGYVFVTGGLNAMKINLLAVGTPPSRLGGSPPKATHVIANTSRILVNRVETPLSDVHFSAIGYGVAITPFETWNTGIEAGSFIVQGKPDSVVALAETMREVWAFGGQSVQVYQPDPNVVYAPTRMRERGLAAPYSVVKVDEVFFWLDQYRRFIAADNAGQPKEISEAIAGTLDALTTVDDCYGTRITMNQFDCVLWTFPTDKLQLCYQIGGGWSRWGTRDEGNWKTLPTKSFAFNRTTEANLVGTTAGRVAEWSISALDDLGTPITAFAQSGFMDRGSDNRKSCDSVKLAFDRPTSSDTTVVGTLRWRNEDGEWCSPLELVLSSPDNVLVFNSLGVYRRRQWEIEFTASEEITLVAATESFTVQSN